MNEEIKRKGFQKVLDTYNNHRRRLSRGMPTEDFKDLIEMEVQGLLEEFRKLASEIVGEKKLRTKEEFHEELSNAYGEISATIYWLLGRLEPEPEFIWEKKKSVIIG